MPVGESLALNHLDRMTDSTGLIQHAIYGVPRRESGYTTDDNARALRLCVRLWDRHPEERMLNRVTTYLSFLEYARGWFHGRNSLKRPLVDVRSGACYDGLQASGVNRNRGAESTLAYLWTEMSHTEVLHLCDNSRAAIVSE